MASIPETQKIPLKAILLVEAENIQVTGGLGDSYDISFRPGLGMGIQAELAAVFEEVTLEESERNVGKGDIVVLAKLHHREAINIWTGTVTSNWEFQFNFRDPLNKLPISTLLCKNQTVVPPSGQTTLASFLTGLCLFICSPITIPWAVQAGGAHAMEVIEAELSGELHKLPEAIRNDHKILAYARGEKADSPIAVLPMIQPSKPRLLSSDVDVIPKPGKPRHHAHAVVIGIEEYQQNFRKPISPHMMQRL